MMVESGRRTIPSDMAVNVHRANPLIRMFVVTYKGRERLKSTLDSLAATTDPVRLQLFIINNHSEFSIEPAHEKFVRRVYHNTLRPDFSTGHLARNWNQALINGFENLKRPACDIVITSQDDVEFMPGWLDRLLEFHERYTFLQFGAGDELCSYQSQAVRNIGIWDEHFCNIGFQEADYFLRAVMFNAQSSSINDHFHGRLHNALDAPEDDGLIVRKMRAEDKVAAVVANTAHQASMQFHSLSASVFRHKFGPDWKYLISDWHPSFRRYLPDRFYCPIYTLYPYFESDVEEPNAKGYLHAFADGKPGFCTAIAQARPRAAFTRICHRLRHAWRVLRHGHLDTDPVRITSTGQP